MVEEDNRLIIVGMLPFVMSDYEPPEFDKGAFNCPYCGVYSKQDWEKLQTIKTNSFLSSKVSLCHNCSNRSYWREGELIYPRESPAPRPNQDMPEDVKEHYNEARNVVSESPRAASALLRLAMEELAAQLNDNYDQKLYENIGDLLESGKIDSDIQKALDSVRVHGNDKVHAGEIKTNDDIQTSKKLFNLVNIIVETTISREKAIEEMYETIPENKQDGINQRDSE